MIEVSAHTTPQIWRLWPMTSVDPGPLKHVWVSLKSHTLTHYVRAARRTACSARLSGCVAHCSISTSSWACVDFVQLAVSGFHRATHTWYSSGWTWQVNSGRKVSSSNHHYKSSRCLALAFLTSNIFSRKRCYW